jgi:hypothetical protein
LKGFPVCIEIGLGPAPVGRYYLETDASLKPWDRRLDAAMGRPTYLGGGGVDIRDPDMRPVEEHSLALGYVSGPTAAEIAALEWGLRRALGLGIQRLRVRNDNLGLIQQLDGNLAPLSAGSTDGLSRVLALSRRFHSVQFRWTRSIHVIQRGDGAHSADFLARKAIGLGLRSR